MRATLAVGDWTGTVPTWVLTSWETLTIRDLFHGGPELTFTITADADLARIDELATDVWVTLETGARYRCRVVAVDLDWDENGNVAAACKAVGYRRLLASRFLHTDYSATAKGQGTIMWELVQHTQARTNGDLGITSGTLSTLARDRTYEAGANIGKLLDQLSRVDNGPWYGIDADLVLDVLAWSALGTVSTPVVLGATARAMSRKSAASEFANAGWFTGDERVTTPIDVATAGVGSDPRGRWETTMSWPTVINQTTLDEHADGALAELSQPPTTWDVTVEPTRWTSDAPYSIGDLVTLVRPRSSLLTIGDASPSVSARVMALAVTITGSGATSVRMTVMEET